MKIAIISDIHGNAAYLDKAKKIIQDNNIPVVICCGDVQDIDTFKELDSWEQQVYLAFGNADFEIRKKLESGLIWANKIKFFVNYGFVNIDHTKIAFCHYPDSARKLAESGNYDLVFYGHNHKPWEETIGKSIMLNPGEIQARDGKPTFAIYDLIEKKAELKILN